MEKSGVISWVLLTIGIMFFGFGSLLMFRGKPLFCKDDRKSEETIESKGLALFLTGFAIMLIGMVLG